MFIFAGEGTKTVIPENRICQIKLVGKTISIYYVGGEVTYLESSGEAVAPKVEKVNINYDSNEIANDVLRSFFVACYNNAGAFYF